jgi:putative transposase
VRFTGEHKGVFGVEPICRVLTQHGAAIAPSTCCAAKARPPSVRAVRDEYLKAELTRVWKENREVYGADTVWLELNRQGISVARCTTGRLMRQLGLQGVRRGKKIRTTVPGRDGHRAGDLLNRDFTAPAPNRRWVAGFTYVAAWSGIVYAAFVVDIYSRAIVGWAAATHKRTKLVLDALQRALWRRDRDGRPAGAGLVPHSDAGSQYTSFVFTAHLIEAGIDASIGTVGDALDNALMESTTGLYKTELIKKEGPWKSLADVELATAEYVDWYNTRRLHTAIGGVPPAEFEAAYHAQTQPDSEAGPNN